MTLWLSIHSHTPRTQSHIHVKEVKGSGWDPNHNPCLLPAPLFRTWLFVLVLLDAAVAGTSGTSSCMFLTSAHLRTYAYLLGFFELVIFDIRGHIRRDWTTFRGLFEILTRQKSCLIDNWITLERRICNIDRKVVY